MNRRILRYHFDDEVDLDYVAGELILAAFNTESLHGAARARVEVAHFLDSEQRSLAVDATTEVGQHFNALFVGGLMHEYGPDSFTVQAVPPSTAAAA